jgi:hypothetical protein
MRAPISRRWDGLLEAEWELADTKALLEHAAARSEPARA